MQSEAGQRLIEFCQENALVIAITLFQQHKRRFYTWTSPDGQHQNQIDYILCSQNFRGGSDSKASVYNAEDLGSSPGLGRSPGEGSGTPLQYYCLENPVDRGAWWAWT